MYKVLFSTIKPVTFAKIMKMDKKHLLTLCVLLFALSFLFPSCATKRNLVYFSNLPDSTIYTQAIANQVEPTIQPNDVLNIRVATLSPDANILFNSGSLPMDNQATGTAQAAPTMMQGYLVDVDGNVNFPVIGKVKVVGLTREQAQDAIAQEVSKTAKAPIVNVQIMNFKISVIGEVMHPGVFNIPNNRVNVLEALGMAGDMTPYAVREKVLVVHEKNGRRSMEWLDMTDKNVFNNPDFYLQQNDVVYVQPYNKIKERNTDPTRFQVWSIITSSVSVLALVIYYISHSK